jgi:predicted amidohydrolase
VTLPGDLFAALWPIVAPSAGAIVARPWDGRFAHEFDAISLLLEEATDADVPAEIEAYLAGQAVPFACGVIPAVERAFVVMCALDAVAIAIHPAMPNRLPGIGRAPTGMLAIMKASRTITGHYADVTGTGMIVPKGHLVSRKRPRPDDAEDASGTDLAHQFAHLTLVAHPGHGRTLRFIAPSPRKFFVSPVRADHVGLAPIAEDRDDIDFITSKRGDRPYLDAVPKAPLLANRITAAVTALLDDGAGVIVLPELVGSTASADALKIALKARGSRTEGLILAGTGASTSVDPGSHRPHNEAMLIGANGRVLAHQRKLHLFNMGINRMRDCDIAAAPGCGTRNHMEDAAAGTELVVCDLHGLGRVMTLICEDLQQQVPGGDLALVLRPDWILTPVLDVSQTAGRWTHSRSIEIGRKTYSRVVVSCCATLGVRVAKGSTLLATTATINTGICFDGADGRRVKLVESTGALAPDRTLIKWEIATWPNHEIVLNPA